MVNAIRQLHEWQRPLPDTLNPLEKGIVHAVAYGDVFDYPLTTGQIYRYLEGVFTTQAMVAVTVTNGRLQPHFLQQTDGYIHLPGRAAIVRTRQRREQIAQKLWPEAVRYGRLIACLPFVRMVALTGSLTMNNADDNADIDYLIVTENGRLWLSRAFIIAVVRLAARRGITICPNYILTERALEFPDKNLYTAHEVAQMVPLSGIDTYEQMRHQNKWVNHFLPNAATSPQPELMTGNGRSRIQAVLELPFRTSLGNRLESWEMTRKINKFQQQQQDNTGETDFCADWCKGHFDGHQHHTLTALEARIGQ
ncbi:MAG: hypothetical protein KC419_20045 [Anaerolineales bacterium]|nr:hypothetical protein [Anaerolineales bacterium]MCA9930792.1 hypothetical protein [Anaerolineales bacterium]